MPLIPLIYSQINVTIFPPIAKILYTLILTYNTPQFLYSFWLTLEASAFLIFHSGNSTFINSFDKTKFLFDSPTDAVAQFL